MPLLNMKRFLSCTFVILILCNPISYAQDKTNTSDTAASSFPKKPEVKAQHKTEENQSNKNQANEKNLPLVVDVNVKGQEISVLSRSDKIAKEANFWAMLQAFFGLGTLVLAGFATFYARRAWLTSRDGGVAQFRPVLTFENIRFQKRRLTNGIDGHIVHWSPADIPNDDRVDFHIKGLVTVKNWGTTPVYQVGMKALCEANIVPAGMAGPNDDLKSRWSPASFLIPMLAPSESKEVEIDIWVIGESSLERENYIQDDGHVINYIALKVEEFFLVIEGDIYFQDVFTLGEPLSRQRHYKAHYSGFPLSKGDVRLFNVYPEEVHKDWHEPEKPNTR